MKLSALDDDDGFPSGGGNGGPGGGEDAGGAGAPVDFSVDRIESLLRTVSQSQDPLKLLFGLGLLFYGRSLPHLILFTHAFKVAPVPTELLVLL